MLRFTLVSQNEEFASYLGAFLFGNSIRQQKSAEGWCGFPRFSRQEYAIPAGM